MHVFSKIAQMRKTIVPLRKQVPGETKHQHRLNLLTKIWSTARKQSNVEGIGVNPDALDVYRVRF